MSSVLVYTPESSGDQSRITHDRHGSLDGHLHYPHDLDGTLNEVAVDKTRQYRTDYNNRPPHRETDRFFAASGVQLA